MPAQPKDYAFEGYVIKLNERDYTTWQNVYHAIPDFHAELYNLDLYYQSEVEAGKDMKGWFHRTSSYLCRKHQEYVYRRQNWQMEALTKWSNADGPVRQ